MFGKKILSIVSLLVLGSRVSAECGAWTPNDDAYTLESGCQKNGYYVAFQENTNDQTGKVLNVDTNVSEKYGVLIKVDGADDTVATKVTDVGYFISGDGKYISNDYQGHAKILDEVEGCIEGNIGKLVKIDDGNARRKRTITYEVCLGEKSTLGEFASVPFSGSDTKKYLLTLDKDKLFSDDAAKGGVISIAEKAITWDNGNDDTDFCVDTDTKVVLTRPAEYCNNSGKDECGSYYSCTSGSCSDTSSAEKRTTGVCNIENSETYGSCQAGYYLKVDNTLMYCTGSRCDPQPNTIGYLVKYGDSENYIKCIAKGEKSGSYEGNVCSTIAISALKNECSAGKGGFGDLIKDDSGNIKICNTETTDVMVTASDETNSVAEYFINANVASGVFTNTAQGESSLVMINIAGGNVILNTKAGNFIYDSTATPTKLQSTLNGSGSLYKCTLNAAGYSLCAADDKTIGYLTNAGDASPSALPYIKCVVSGSDNSCSAIASITSETECSKVGDIIKPAEYKICVYADKDAVNSETLTSIDLTNGHFFVDASDNSGIFVQTAAAGHYVIINVNGGDITLNKDVKKYRYAIGSQVYFKGEKDSDVCNDATSMKSGVTEYVLKKDEGDKDDYYKAN